MSRGATPIEPVDGFAELALDGSRVWLCLNAPDGKQHKFSFRPEAFGDLVHMLMSFEASLNVAREISHAAEKSGAEGHSTVPEVVRIQEVAALHCVMRIEGDAALLDLTILNGQRERLAFPAQAVEILRMALLAPGADPLQ